MTGPHDARGTGGPGGYAGDGIEVPATDEPGTDATEATGAAEGSEETEGAGGPGGYAGDGIEVPAPDPA